VAEVFSLGIPIGWYAVVESSELLPGDVRELRAFGQDLVLFRTESGRAHVVDAYCPHLGAHLAAWPEDKPARAEGETIRCPFHHWRFDGRGRCVEIPYSKSVPAAFREKQVLRSWPVEELMGLIFVWHHPNEAPPLWQPQLIEEFVSPDWLHVIREEWVIDAAIQEIQENLVYRAHNMTIHGATAPESIFDFDGHRLRGSQRSPFTRRSGVEDFTCVEPFLFGPGQGYTVHTGFMPSLNFSRMLPIEMNRTSVRLDILLKAEEAAAFGEQGIRAIGKEVIRQFNQDLTIWNRKRYEPRPLLAEGDGPIAQFRRWYSQFYVEPKTVSNPEAESRTA
jgi:phenylpropionate dioxygenase-like ring-hydroxylating dioxygenase large terminal subunit